MVKSVCHAVKCNAYMVGLDILCGALELATIKLHQLSGIAELCCVPECYAAQRAIPSISLLL